MKRNPDNRLSEEDSMQPLHERVKCARLKNADSPSNVYDLVYMNSAITGAKVSRQTCEALLGQMPEWKYLPIRVKKGLMEDIMDYMTVDKLPSYKAVWDKINEHPLFVRYRSGEMPAVSVQESILECDEREKRENDIAQIRLKAAREAGFISELVEEYLQFDIEEAPTEPGIPPSVPLAKTASRKVPARSAAPKIPEANWDESGSRYSLHTAKKRA